MQIQWLETHLHKMLFFMDFFSTNDAIETTIRISIIFSPQSHKENEERKLENLINKCYIHYEIKIKRLLLESDYKSKSKFLLKYAHQ